MERELNAEIQRIRGVTEELRHKLRKIRDDKYVMISEER